MLNDVKMQLSTLRDGLISCARLLATITIEQKELREKLDLFLLSERHITICESIESLSARQFRFTPSDIKFSISTNQILLSNRHEKYFECLDKENRRLISISDEICEIINKHPLLSHIQAVVTQTAKLAIETRLLMDNLRSIDTSEFITDEPINKMQLLSNQLRGPKSMRLPDCFEMGDSVLIRQQTTFSNEYLSVIEYLWNRSARECSASALCALNVLENQSMPLAFYADTIRQGSDEMRHACFYWNAFELEVPKILINDPQNSVVEQVKRFVNFGIGLRLPREGVFYDLYWNCNLTQRLCLMNIDTEGPGLRKFKPRITWAKNNNMNYLAEGMTTDFEDEKFHARIGHYWLRKIIPDKDMRATELELSRLLRGFYIITACANANNMSVAKLSDELLATC